MKNLEEEIDNQKQNYYYIIEYIRVKCEIAQHENIYTFDFLSQCKK